jgi:hypothetical protein
LSFGRLGFSSKNRRLRRATPPHWALFFEEIGACGGVLLFEIRNCKNMKVVERE